MMRAITVNENLKTITMTDYVRVWCLSKLFNLRRSVSLKTYLFCVSFISGGAYLALNNAVASLGL